MSKIALLGFGVIGSGTAEVLVKNRSLISERLGLEAQIKYILDLRDFPDSPFAPLIVHDINIILEDSDIDIVVEMMGGSHPAYEFSLAAIERGKSVVTSNKQVVAEYGEKLLAAAVANGVKYLFEASVGGGIPIIRPMQNDLAAYKINSINAILNGTTNYILTQMASEGSSFDDALEGARRNGYAEANPADDIMGVDSARKILILTAIATGKMFTTSDIFIKGITEVTKTDIATAKAADCSIKLVAHMNVSDSGSSISVSPAFVRKTNPLAGINGVFNGILINADELGDVMFYGKGAGKYPTAGAVISDIVEIMGQRSANSKNTSWKNADNADKATVIKAVSDEKYPRCITLRGVTDDVPAEYSAFIPAEGFVSYITKPLNSSEADAISEALGDRVCSLYKVL